MATKKQATNRVLNTDKTLASVIKNPRLTEKATMLAEGNVYTFNILPGTNKTQVTQAVEALFGVTPRAVRIVNGKQKHVFVRGKYGKTASVKKAYVALKKGDKISLM